MTGSVGHPISLAERRTIRVRWSARVAVGDLGLQIGRSAGTGLALVSWEPGFLPICGLMSTWSGVSPRPLVPDRGALPSLSRKRD
jgi:hypothetical protein